MGKDYFTFDEVKDQVNKLPINENHWSIQVFAYSYKVQVWSISTFEINKDALMGAPSDELHAHLVRTMINKLEAELYHNKQPIP